MHRTTVELTLPEFGQAVSTAWMRIMVSAAQGLNHSTTYKRTLITRLQEEVVGACGELAMGKYTDKFFIPSINTFHRVPDCLNDVEVRATSVPHGRLIVRDNDASDRRYVLALVDGHKVRLAGWILGGDAKIAAFADNPHGRRMAWFVPHSSLLRMEDF